MRAASVASFDYAAVVEHGDLQQNIALELGDTVIIP